jgi:hypothetical protein
MPKGSSKTTPKKKRKREDEAQAAVRVMTTIIERTEETAPIEITPEMRAAAAAFGRQGGLKGGPARAAALTAKKRSEIAKKAAQSRWSKR